MTLYGLRLLVALMTFAVGAAAAWLFDFKSPQPAEGRVVTREVLRFTHTTDVEVPARSCYYSRRFVAGGILNGKALSKPAPVYPRAAKASGVAGTVAVEVVVDESGMVETAEAVSGEPDFTLVISGENFFTGSVIVFGTHDEPTTFDEEAGTVSTGVKPSLFAPAVVPVKVRNGPLVSDPSDFTFTGAEADDQDALENEIDDAIDEGDATVRKPKGKKK